MEIRRNTRRENKWQRLWGGALVRFVRAYVGCHECRELFYILGCGLCVDSFVSRLFPGVVVVDVDVLEFLQVRGLKSNGDSQL